MDSMRTMVRRLACAAGMAVCAVAADATAGAGTITITIDPPGFYGLYGGGEFGVSQFTGTDALAPLGPGVAVPGLYFQTFCAQFDQHIEPGVQYGYVTSPFLDDDPSTPLPPQVAFLYSKFWDAALAPTYDYTFPPTATSNRPGSATSLQLAMWHILGETATHADLAAAYAGDAQAQAWVAQANAAVSSGAWSGLGNVRVLVLTSASGENQDLLIKLALGDGLTPGWWQNKNGQALIGADDLKLLTDLCLVNADGKNFCPKTAAEVGEWITGDAVNMAYKLSTILAATELNVLNGFVDKSDLVYTEDCAWAFGGAAQITVADLMTKANDDLCLRGHNNTVSSSSVRTYQECLKNVLDRANNNLNWVSP